MTGLALVKGWFCQMMLAEFSTAWNRSRVITRIDPDAIKEDPARHSRR